MTPEWLIILPVAGTVALIGSTGFIVKKKFQERKLLRLAVLKSEHSRLEAAVSELLSRVNDIDLASKYYENTSPLVSTRLGDICTRVGQLAESVSAADALLEQANVNQARKLILSSLSLALQLSNEINSLRSEFRG